MNDDSKKLTILSRGGVEREGTYITPATSRGAIALVKLGVLQTLYRFSVKNGQGQGNARAWHVAPKDMERFRAMVRKDVKK